MKLTQEKSAEWENRANEIVESIKVAPPLSKNEKFMQLREHCRPMTYYIINGVAFQPPITTTELKQVADIVLWKCCMEYDKTRGTKFSTYYIKSLKNSEYYYVKHNQMPVQNVYIDYNEIDEKYISEEDKYEWENEYESPAVNYAMSFLTEKEKELLKLLDTHNYNSASLSEEIGVSRQAISRKKTKLLRKIKERMAEYEQ